jgi:hypothetical protein
MFDIVCRQTVNGDPVIAGPGVISSSVTAQDGSIAAESAFSLSMLDESILGMPFLTGSLVAFFMLIAWFRRVDPLVSFYLALLHVGHEAYIRLISLARCYSSSRI